MRFAFRHHRWHHPYYSRYDAGYYTPWNDYQSRVWASDNYGDWDDCDDWY